MGTEQGFEASLAELERRVRLLESGEIPLEEALRHYEQGVALARECHAYLDAAEQRVTALREGARGLEEEPLPEPEEI
ncbi:MAG: exodeoxyribonuclease VII small subunit [Deltaproteobacteria bacterium]|nr:exodeoxyribonuclease VII small subunit [Deltaproteobacteria bacterium]